MKRLIFILLLIGSLKLTAQISEGGLPITYQIAGLKSTSEIPVYTLTKLDADRLMAEDRENNKLPARYAVFEEIHIDIKSEGLHDKISDHNGEIWRYKIVANDAKSIQLAFSEFIVPEGATLFIYNDSYTRIYGAFTTRNMMHDHSFVTADLNSDHMIIEYFEPYNKESDSKIIIGQIGQAYKDIFKSSAVEDGFVGINCYEGREFQNEKHSVCRFTYRSGNSGYLCTGALINNVRNDGTPFFLTANHCINDSATAKSMVAYFNYESATCQGTTPLNYNSLSGASLLTTGTRSDYSLLLLSSEPPPDYKPYYAGWDISDLPGTSSVSIHHGNGTTKKISVDYAPPVSYDKILWWSTYSYSPANSHWKVQFDAGRTSSGSSGAPLFNMDNKITGQLHGGDDQIDFYGKLSYSWTKSDLKYNTLKSFLDPENTDTTSIDGYYPVENLPDAQFFTGFNTVCKDAPVNLMDGSAFNASSWNWTITPGPINYLNGTDQTSENPVISFIVPGSYTVELLVENSAGSDIITKSSFITVGDNLSPGILPVNITDSCLCRFDSLTVMASGASSYSWSLSDETKKNFFLQDTAAAVTFIQSLHEEINDTVTGISLYLTGYHGSCSDTVQMVYPLLRQPNDNIEDALLLELGTNGPFTNKCASVQEFEPVPPHYSCTDQLSWCNETGVDIVTNSVWFYFIAPASGTVSLSSRGFDNEIAIYKADAVQDILNGKYTIIAANDDRTESDYNPVIKNASVIPQKVYWVQVDGSGGGSEGSFFLELDDEQIISGNQDLTYSTLKLYPQPAGETITVESTEFLQAHEMLLEIFTIAGTRIYATKVPGPLESRLMIHTGEWNRGIYFIRISFNGNTLYGKFVK
ncbi:MAG: trypsin-like peptidase domain-containing protein [Bacteroidales bacterium]|nr:trypsin-like peptidase domain-containing protein [Bacteroidales bacterium]